MLVFIAGLAVAFLVFRSLGAQRLGGILRRAFWCCYVLWVVLLVHVCISKISYEAIWTAGPFLVGPLVIYRLVSFIATGRWG